MIGHHLIHLSRRWVTFGLVEAKGLTWSQFERQLILPKTAKLLISKHPSKSLPPPFGSFSVDLH